MWNERVKEGETVMQVVLANCSRLWKASAKKNVTKGGRDKKACRLPENAFFYSFLLLLSFVLFFFFFHLFSLIRERNVIFFSISVFRCVLIRPPYNSIILSDSDAGFYFFSFSSFLFRDELPWRHGLIISFVYTCSFFHTSLLLYLNFFPAFQVILIYLIFYWSFMIYVPLAIFVIFFFLYSFFPSFSYFIFISLELLLLINVIGSWHGVLVGERHDSNFLAGRRLLHARQVPPLI